MDRASLRKYGLYFLLPLFCAGTLIYILLISERELTAIDTQVAHTYTVITGTERLSYLIEGMVASQRGYIITGSETFLERFQRRRDNISELLAHLSELLNKNSAQTSRLNQIRISFDDLSTRLEERARLFARATQLPPKGFLEETEAIDSTRENIIDLTEAILLEEYNFLDDRIEEIETKKTFYFVILLVSIVAASALLLAFNGYLIQSQKKRSWFEKSLKSSEERYALALEGAKDGIFDWDLETGEVFYSAQFFHMLGYTRNSFTGTFKEFEKLLHPDDRPPVLARINKYLNREIPEYTQDFRLKHKDGHWVWIHSRAKGVFSSSGKAIRMVGAHTDITPAKEHEERLTNEKMQAEAANIAKRDFLAHMSHEIRTPLTAISGITEIFEKRKENLDNRQQKLVKTLSTSVAVLKGLINDILDFSKIETGELELSHEPFLIEAPLKEIRNMMALRANEKGLEFSFDLKDIEDAYFPGDAERLRQIVSNLIGNALKFTEKGGVSVRAYKETRDGNPYLRIDVTDTGIGIAPENFELVFERFKQEDSSISRKYGGTGLGLSISKNLAQLMGGDILLSSALGEGSTFSVILPWREIQNGETSDWREKTVSEDVTTKKRILVVEDYEGNVVFLSFILEEMGFDFDVAGTGKEAVSLWTKKEYDLILMDIQLPEMDGLAATKVIRGLEKEKSENQTPIIGMTAHALVGDREKCFEAGMDSYLPKPIVEADLKREIKSRLGAKKKAA